MDFSFGDNFFECFDVFVSFNIDQCLSEWTDKISMLLYYDEMLDVEKKKRQLDQFEIKSKLIECGWQVPCEITT